MKPALSCFAVGGLLVGLWWFSVGADSQKETKARQAITAALDACSANGRDEFAHRIVEAKAAIRELPSDRQTELEISMRNQLTLSLCAGGDYSGMNAQRSNEQHAMEQVSRASLAAARARSQREALAAAQRQTQAEERAFTEAMEVRRTCLRQYSIDTPIYQVSSQCANVIASAKDATMKRGAYSGAIR